MADTPATLEARIARLEAVQAIQSLAVRYAMAVDARDLDAWLAMFPDDIDCGRRGVGREALRSFIAPAVKDFYRTVHMIVGHVVDEVQGDRATGRVYCRAEHELGDQWIVQAICYFDTYERRDGEWLFRQRIEDFFYSCDVLERPQEPAFQRWPGPAPRHAPPMMAGRFPSWLSFWAEASAEEVAKVTRFPVQSAV